MAGMGGGGEAGTGGMGMAGSGNGGMGGMGMAGNGGMGGTPISCVPGALAPCYTGPQNTFGVGACKGGQWLCNAEGNGYGPCTGQVIPTQEVCNAFGDPTVDEDCNGTADEGCNCAPGATLVCYSGTIETKGVGACKAGVQTCDAMGTAFGPCVGEVLPVAETCATPDDDDCDGMVNESGVGCVCQPGQTMDCYSGMPGTQNQGVCVGGTQTCNTDGTAYGPCVGERVPEPEMCDAQMLDEDCDGKVNEAGANCICGDGIISIDLGEQCDDRNTNEYDGCKANCMLGCGPAYAGSVAPQTSAWTYQGSDGVEAGNMMCKALGAAGICDYEQVKLAVAQGELNGDPSITTGVTAWIHRTTPETVGATVYPPGPGGRCNDWLFNGNHLADGEYVTFTKSGAIVTAQYLLDSDTIYDATTNHVQPGLDCGGVSRRILCCHPRCP